jgi:hypothetical protein
MLLLAGWASAAEMLIYGDRPNVLRFVPVEARYVRLVIMATSGAEPCIDELEVYGPAGNDNLARAKDAKASASSCLAGYPQHAIGHLNDGAYGNGASWIPAKTSGEWAQIDLGQTGKVDRVVISRDREGQFADRIPTQMAVQASPDGTTWQTVLEVSGKATTAGRPGTFRGVVGEPPPLPPANAPAGTAASPGEARRANEYGLANLALGAGAKAAASSCLEGYAIHRIEHLNDGKTGNDHSWIAGALPAWAEVDLGATFWVTHIAFGSDQGHRFQDRAASAFRLLGTAHYEADSAAATWAALYRHGARPPVSDRLDIHLKPVQARWLRVAIEASAGDLPRIDELEVFGSPEAIPDDKVGPLSEVERAADPVAEDLRYAFLGEEHAWLKVAGHADLSSRLVPYNGRVKDYPKHAGDDVLPLPELPAAPVPDGRIDEGCWSRASRGLARVAWPYDFDTGPLIGSSVRAGTVGEDLYLAIETNRLLSAHVAVVSAGDGEGCGVVTVVPGSLEFRRFRKEGERVVADSAEPARGAVDRERCTIEVVLPLAWFGGWQETGLRIGLGMGGRHTAAEGRGVAFLRAPLAVVEAVATEPGGFVVRLQAAAGSPPAVSVNWPGAEPVAVDWQGGEAQVRVPGADGVAGLWRDVEIAAEGLPAFRLHLFRYDPTHRVLRDLDALLARLAGKGVQVADSAERVTALRQRHAQQGALAGKDRGLFFAARSLEREAFLRDPDLGALRSLLFVKRHPFHPSHNYSDFLDSTWRPGGGICRLDMPWAGQRLVPEKGVVTPLFEAGTGVARDPVATADASQVYFSYRASQPEYFRITRMNADGSGVTTLGEGPYNDVYPLPLPDGDLGFISTRCRARFLCWRPQAYVLFRMTAAAADIRPLSYANLSEWAPSLMRDGRILWTRSEYVDKGADFSHTLWSVHPDGTHPELVFGNTIIQPNGYANGRQVPGTHEVTCTLISHFGDLNGPIALLDLDQGRFTRDAIASLTPEVPWPGMWPECECFRDPVPISRDLVLCAHAPREQFALYVIDRYGNRELLHLDGSIGSMCPTPFRPQVQAPRLPVAQVEDEAEGFGEMTVADVYAGISPPVERGQVAYLRIACEVRAGLTQLEDGSYRQDHEPFMHWYAGPVDKVAGPFGWPSYVAKASLGLVPVEPDGSAHFRVPAGKVVYFQALDKDLNELQRMRSVVQLQPGEKRSCIGCHDDRRTAPAVARKLALRREADTPQPPPWGAVPFAYEEVVQPVLDRHCTRCHNPQHPKSLDLTGTLDADRIPASYKTLIRSGLVHHLDYQYNAGGNEKKPPLSFGVLQSRLVKVLEAGHHQVSLTPDEWHAIKCWIDLNCPLWPDYQLREERPGPELATGK